MNASGPRSAERGEIYELAAVHRGAIVFKSCNLAGLDAPDNLKNAGAEHFAAIAGELTPRGKAIIASIVGTSEEEFIAVARRLDRAGAAILELNLADPYVLNSLAPFASLDRLKALVGRVRGEIGCALAVKLPPAAGYPIDTELTRLVLNAHGPGPPGTLANGQPANEQLSEQLPNLAWRQRPVGPVPRAKLIDHAQEIVHDDVGGDVSTERPCRYPLVHERTELVLVSPPFGADLSLFVPRQHVQ